MSWPTVKKESEKKKTAKNMAAKHKYGQAPKSVKKHG